MYPELVKYKQIKKQYEEQLERLRLEQLDLEEEKEELLTKYEKVLSKIGYRHQSDPTDTSRVRSEVQSLTDELGDVMEQISHLSNAKKERLNEWIQPLQKGLDREVIAAKQHLKIKKEEFRRYRMELFLLIQQLFEIEEYVHDIHRSYTEACEEHMSSEEKRTLNLQTIHIRKEVKHQLEELHSDLDNVVKTGKMPEWFNENMQK